MHFGLASTLCSTGADSGFRRSGIAIAIYMPRGNRLRGPNAREGSESVSRNPSSDDDKVPCSTHSWGAVRCRLVASPSGSREMTPVARFSHHHKWQPSNCVHRPNSLRSVRLCVLGDVTSSALKPQYHVIIRTNVETDTGDSASDVNGA